MKASQYQAYGGYEENRLVEVDRPKPKDSEVPVKMSTVGINPLYNTFRSGHIYLATPANVPRVGDLLACVTRASRPTETGACWTITSPSSPTPAARTP